MRLEGQPNSVKIMEDTTDDRIPYDPNTPIGDKSDDMIPVETATNMLCNPKEKLSGTMRRKLIRSREKVMHSRAPIVFNHNEKAYRYKQSVIDKADDPKTLKPNKLATMKMKQLHVKYRQARRKALHCEKLVQRTTVPMFQYLVTQKVYVWHRLADTFRDEILRRFDICLNTAKKV